MDSIARLTTGRNLRMRAMEFLRDESGPTAAEYAIMLAVLLVIVIGAVTAMGEAHRQVWTDVGTALAPVTGAAGS